MAQDEDWCRARDIVFRQQSAAERGPGVENLEVAAGHQRQANAKDAAGLADRHHVRAAVREKPHLLQGSRLPRELSGIREEQWEVVEAPITRGPPEHDHTTLITNGKRAEKKRLGHREHRGRESDSNGKRKDCRQREPWSAAKTPKTYADILDEPAHDAGLAKAPAVAPRRSRRV
jgi:hypothetical protein